MKNSKTSIAVLLVLLASAAVAISAADAPLLSRAQLAAAEQGVDSKMLRLWNDNSISLVGPSRAAYLPGMGLVLSAEVTLATAPTSLMAGALTDKDKAELRKKKAERLPLLRTAMKLVMVNLATSLSQVPATEQIAISVVLPRYSWEEASGLPMQVTMQATKQDLLGGQPVIRVIETN